MRFGLGFGLGAGSKSLSYANTLGALAGVTSVYLRKVDADTFGIGMMQANGGGTEWRQKKDGDSFLSMKGAYCGLTYSSEHIKPTLAGTFITSSNNSYTTVINSTLSFSFTGTGFYFRSFKDNRGGLWKFTVDGVDVATISVYNATSLSNQETLIVSGLTDATHSVVATFLGADPENPPSGGTARGWFIYDFQNTGTANSTAKVISRINPAGIVVGSVDIFTGSSVTDFAISATGQGSGMTGTWVPSHSGVTNVVRSLVKTLLVDGVSVNTDPNVLAAQMTVTDSVVFMQTYTAYNGNDAGGTYPLWDGIIEHRYDRSGLTVTHSLDFKYGDVVATGYLAMLPSKVGNADKLITNAGENIAIAAGDASVPFSRLASSVAYINNTTGNGCAIDVNLSQVLDQSLTDPFFYTIRPDDVTKVYWKKVSGTVTTGTKMSCVNRYSAAAGVNLTNW